jgi:hypothetical protein
VARAFGGRALVLLMFYPTDYGTMRTYNTLLLAAGLLLLAACASTGSGTSSNPNVITAADVQEAANYSSAYQLVERLQPQWLRKRSGGITFNEVNEEMEGDVVVYVNDVRVGGPDALRDVSVDAVERIEYLDAARAARYGTGHQHGAILVTTR